MPTQEEVTKVLENLVMFVTAAITPEEFLLLRQPTEFRLLPEQAIGFRPFWWGFESNKPHPPYPLIGLEYEPQLTLLNYTKKKIHLMKRSQYEINVTTDIIIDGIMLNLPYNYHNNIDQDNLEFRTPPVKFEDLPEEIAKLQTEIETLVMEIAKAVGPVGIFLPAHPCTKHINLSGFDEAVTRKNFRAEDLEPKPCGFGIRYHLKVPYNFVDYNHITSASLFSSLQAKPILLGYSMTGDSFVRRCQLP